MSSAARQSSARSMRAVGAGCRTRCRRAARMPSNRPSSARIARRVRERARFVEAVGHRERLAVIGDGDVLEARGRARPRPSSRRSSRPSVSVVCMCRSPRRSASVNSARQRCRSAASISPRFSRSSGGIQCEAERLVDAPPRSRRRPARRRRTRNRPYSFSFKPRCDGAVAQRDVVRLRAGEVLHGGAAAVGGTRRRSAWNPPGAGRSTSCRPARARVRRAGTR